jgi:hypothetical protein
MTCWKLWAVSYTSSIAGHIEPYACVQGADSKYEPFLSLLPAAHDCTLGWTEEEAAELEGKCLGASHDTNGITGHTRELQSFFLTKQDIL